MLTSDWTDTLDALVWDAIVEGRVSGAITGKPDKVIESGLAHIFFYDDTVYKLYKTHADKDHFIKGVLAPTTKRNEFMEHDFKLNSHFSKSVYINRYSLDYEAGIARVVPYHGRSIYKLIEMKRLDFEDNFHEQLLRREVKVDDYFNIGHEIAQSIDSYEINLPDSINWYDLATERVHILKQFLGWMKPEFSELVENSEAVSALEAHLEKYKNEYLQIKGNELSVNLDNHDENIFIVEGTPQFIDLLPPMSSWWYGLPHANLSNIMANVEVLASYEDAQKIQEGYLEYYQEDSIPEHSFGFTHAFAYLISIAHFSSVEGKEEVVFGYTKRLGDIKGWL